jgi:MFS family permease
LVGLGGVLIAVFAFNLASAGWSAVVAGRLMQDGVATQILGLLYAICEISRLPAALLLPTVTLRYGARRVTQAGLIALLVVPGIAFSGLGNEQMIAIFVLSALPAIAVYVGMPALVIGASRPGGDGSALAWLGLAGGAGGALGPWVGGWLADSYGLASVVFLFAAGSLVMLPVATFGSLPLRTPWPGWSVLAGRGLPVQALMALGLASAADAGRAALVPNVLVRQGQPLGDVGLMLTVGCAIAGVGFLAFGRMADRQSANRVIGAGVVVLIVGSFGAAIVTGFAPAFVVAAAVLGMGASGMRLGAELALISWLGRDRAAVAAALGETTVLGGRALGAPAAGTLGTAYGGASAFGAIGVVALVALTISLWDRRPGGWWRNVGAARVVHQADARPAAILVAGDRILPAPGLPAD